MRCDEEERIVISRVLSGGVASRTGILHVGDIVHEINEKSVRGWSIDQVATYMVMSCFEEIFTVLEIAIIVIM